MESSAESPWIETFEGSRLLEIWQDNCLLGIQLETCYLSCHSCYEGFRPPRGYGVLRRHLQLPCQMIHPSADLRVASAARRLRSNGPGFTDPSSPPVNSI